MAYTQYLVLCGFLSFGINWFLCIFSLLLYHYLSANDSNCLRIHGGSELKNHGVAFAKYGYDARYDVFLCFFPTLLCSTGY